MKILFFLDPFYPEIQGAALKKELQTRGFQILETALQGADEKFHGLGFGFGAYRLMKYTEKNLHQLDKLILISPDVYPEKKIGLLDAWFYSLPGLKSFWFKSTYAKYGASSVQSFESHWRERRLQAQDRVSGSSLLPFKGLSIFGRLDQQMSATAQENELKRTCPAVKIEELHGAQHHLIESHAAKIADMILREIKN